MTAPGKYDFEAQGLLQQLAAQGLILIVINGDRGTGMSVKSDPLVLATLPNILRRTADMIESEVKADVARIGRSR